MAPEMEGTDQARRDRGDVSRGKEVGSPVDLSKDLAGLRLWAGRHNLRQVISHFEAMARVVEGAVAGGGPRARADADLAHEYNAAYAVLRTCAFVEEELALAWRFLRSSPPPEGQVHA